MSETQTNNESEPKWFIDENIPGVGERPSWLPPKFKTVADMAKSNAELEKKLGTAPESYDFSKSKYLDPNYEPFHELQQIAKEKRVPKEFVDKMIESVDKYMGEFSTDVNEEYKKLGDNAKERLTILDNWVKANLSEDSYHALTDRLTNAESIKALEEIRGKMMSNNIQVPNQNSQTDGAISVSDIKNEISANYDKYKKDEGYRKDVLRRLQIASKDSPEYIDKRGG